MSAPGTSRTSRGVRLESAKWVKADNDAVAVTNRDFMSTQIAFLVLGTMAPLILKRAPIGDNQDDYSVLEDGVVVGRIFTVPTAPQGRPWMWASGHNGDIKRAAYGYAATREEAMAAFAKSWRRE